MKKALLALSLLASSWHVNAEEVVVAVAANFKAPMVKIAQLFEQDTAHKAVLSFGATGKFYTQIRNGGPFHILLAADDETPAKIARDGLGVAGTRFTYAIGKLVLWSKQAALVDPRGDVLNSDKFQRLAIADPKLAPYGQAAIETMTQLGVLQHIHAKLVQGENISQAYQFAATGNAQLGFVALSQVFEKGQIKDGSAWVVPQSLYQPIRQDAILLGNAKGNQAALSLLSYLKSEKAQQVIRAHGYEL